MVAASPLQRLVRHSLLVFLTALAAIAAGVTLAAQRGSAPAPPDPIKTLVDRLDLERYKGTIKGLTQFGDRREGTDRNRAAIDWIEAQLKSYGCTNTERLVYNFQPRPPARVSLLRTQGRARRGSSNPGQTVKLSGPNTEN